MTNETKNDIIEIKNLLTTIQKNINIIEKALEEDFMNDKIIEYCDRTLSKLHNEYIELIIEVNTEE